MRSRPVLQKTINYLCILFFAIFVFEFGFRIILSISLTHYLTKVLPQPYGSFMQTVGRFDRNTFTFVNKFDPFCGYIPRHGFFRGDENIGFHRNSLVGSLGLHRSSDDFILQKANATAIPLDNLSEQQLAAALANVLVAPDFYKAVVSQIEEMQLSSVARKLLQKLKDNISGLDAYEILRLNRELLEQIYPSEIIPIRHNPRRVNFPKQKENGEIRIICIGDSTTYGVAVANQDSWVYLLEKKLKAAYPRKNIKVLNAGVPGASSRQIKRTFQFYLADYQADILIWRGGNSLTDYYEVNLTSSKIRFFIWQCLYESRIFRALCVLVDQSGLIDRNISKVRRSCSSIVQDFVTDIDPPDRRLVGKFDSDFSIVKDIAQKRGVRYVLQVERLNYRSDGKIAGEFEQYGGHDPAVGMLAVFQKYQRENPTKELFVDNCHLTEIGEELTAEEVAKYIINRKWVETYNSQSNWQIIRS